MKQLRMGEVLLAEKCITEQQLNDALALQKSNKKRLGEILIDQKMITEDQMLDALSKRVGAKRVELNQISVDLTAVAAIPKNIAVKYRLLAISKTATTLTVVINDPLNFYAIEDIKFITNMQVETVIARLEDIEQAIRQAYSEIDVMSAAKTANESAGSDDAVLQMENLGESDDDTPVVTLVNTMLYKAYSNRASDIHVEPFDDKTVVRIRIDGQIVELLTLSGALHNSIIARIKILSSMNIAERRLPQDGHFRARLNGIELNVRVSIMPTIYGEKAVLRFLNKNAAIDNSGSFGMTAADYAKFSGTLTSPYGIIYITGPTGSGKTTTLYMVLEELAKRNVNICTIEDPVERNIPRIIQTQTNVTAGLTFESGLRALLRQDPDIIMVGETRDSETASISVRAAITGHLVLSTIHTNDAVSAIVRLQDMGVESYLIANSLVAVVAQRLVKKICVHCKTPYAASDAEKTILGNHAETLYKGVGCPACNGTGYKGRVAIHEIFILDSIVRSMIAREEPIENIYKYLKDNNKIVPLRTSVTKLILDGTAPIDELTKLTYFVD